LYGVSCTSATACTAVGDDSNLDGTNYSSLVEVWNGENWAIEPTATPIPTLGGAQTGLTSLSCASATVCTALGFSTTDSAPTADRTLVEAQNGKRWAIEPTPNPATDDLSGVSCTSAATCTAVGEYTNRAGTQLPLAEVWNGKTWAIEDTADLGTEQNSYLSALSCTSATFCTAVGVSDGKTLAERLPMSGGVPVH
jgi:hypothetical protein